MTTAYIINDNDFTTPSFSDFLDTGKMWLYIVIGSIIIIICCIAGCIVAIKKKERNRKSIDFIGGTPDYNASQKRGHAVIIKTSSISTQSQEMKQSADSNIDPALVDWLQSSLELPEYVDNFIQHGYSNMNMIQQIEATAQLAHIGITKKNHQTMILDEISRLKHHHTLPNHNQLSLKDTKSVIEIKMAKHTDVVHIMANYVAPQTQRGTIIVEEGGARKYNTEIDVDALIDNMGDLPSSIQKVQATMEQSDDGTYPSRRTLTETALGNVLTVEGPMDSNMVISGQNENIRKEGNSAMNDVMQAIGEDINHLTDIGDIVAGT